jgi:hypothetical protein
MSDFGVDLGISVGQMCKLVTYPPDGKLFNDFVVP